MRIRKTNKDCRKLLKITKRLPVTLPDARVLFIINGPILIDGKLTGKRYLQDEIVPTLAFKFLNPEDPDILNVVFVPKKLESHLIRSYLSEVI